MLEMMLMGGYRAPVNLNGFALFGGGGFPVYKNGITK
jgi:hypothetical protein